MSSEATAQIQVSSSPINASEALIAIIEEHGFTIGADSTPGSAQIDFRAKRGGFSPEILGSVRITAHDLGSLLDFQLACPPSEPGMALNGRRNRKKLAKLTDQVTSKLG